MPSASCVRGLQQTLSSFQNHPQTILLWSKAYPNSQEGWWCETHCNRNHLPQAHQLCCHVQPQGEATWLLLSSAVWCVGIPGGAENVVHCVRNLLSDHPDWVLVSLDLVNAFNSVSRPAFFRASRRALPQHSPLGVAVLLTTLLPVDKRDRTQSPQHLV